MIKEHYDALVIGMGLTGSCAAKELSEGGMNVAALEAGPLLNDSFFYQAWNKEEIFDLKAQLFRIKSYLSPRHEPQLNKALFYRAKNIFINENENLFSTPEGQSYKWYKSKVVGGRGHVWGRVSPRFTDNEFKVASMNGRGFDWPFSLSTLSNYYEEVELIMKLGGAPSESGRLIDGEFVGSRSLNMLENRFKSTLQDMWQYRILDTKPVLEYEPSPISPMLSLGLKTKKVSIKPNTIAKKIITYPDGYAYGVECINNKSKKEILYTADVIVLAASPIETIRLMRGSVCGKHPVGIGNSSGLLGKYFFEHVITDYFTTLPKELCEADTTNTLNPFKPNADPHGFYITPFRNLEKKDLGFEGNYAIHGSISPNNKRIYIGMFGESLPSSKNKIELDKVRKDKWGIPLPKIIYKWSENEVKMWLDQKKVLREMLEVFENSLNLKKINNPLTSHLLNSLAFKKMPIPGSAAHESGGARMGVDPADSVVNSFNRVWDAPNILVCDASCFPSMGYQNLALTAMALSVRACRNIVKIAKNTNDLRTI